MTYSSFEDRYDQEKEEARQALAQHPGRCEVTYYVYRQEHTKIFEKLLDAFVWVARRERDGAQSTSHYTLDDGSILEAGIAAWHLADELVEEE